jgi:hypothetical protein
VTRPSRDDDPRPASLEVSGSGAAAGPGAVAAGAGGIAIGGQARVGTIHFGEFADPGRALRAPYLPLPPEIVQRPNLLLRPRYGVVPYSTRSGDLAALQRWAFDTRQCRLALVTGSGGSGKTRLAAELAERCRRAGWMSGFLVSRPPELGLEGVVRAAAPVLIAIDEADSRVAQVHQLLESLAEQRNRSWRVVLIARDAGDWWQGLKSALRDSSAEAIADVVARYPLQATDLGLPDRLTTFRAASEAFGTALGVPIDLSAPPLADVRFGRPLYILLAALSAALTKRGLASDDPADLIADALEREREYWSRSARDRDRLDFRREELARAVAVACLADVAGEAEAIEALRAVPDVTEVTERGRRIQMARWLHDLYPPDASESWLPALEPDLLAEAHLSQVLAEDPSLAQRVLASTSMDRSGKALWVLTRAARDHPEARAALEAAYAVLTAGYHQLPLDEVEEVRGIFCGGSRQTGMQLIVTTHRLLLGPISLRLATGRLRTILDAVAPGSLAAGDFALRRLPVTKTSVPLSDVVSVEPGGDGGWFASPSVRIRLVSRRVIEFGFVISPYGIEPRPSKPPRPRPRIAADPRGGCARRSPFPTRRADERPVTGPSRDAGGRSRHARHRNLTSPSISDRAMVDANQPEAGTAPPRDAETGCRQNQDERLRPLHAQEALSIVGGVWQNSQDFDLNWGLET